LLFLRLLQWEIRVNSTHRDSAEGGQPIRWRHSSKPDSCLKGTVGSLFSIDSWVERSKTEQERNSVAEVWEGRSWEGCELIPAPALAASGILGKSPVRLPSLFSLACLESKSSSQFCWVTGCSTVVFVGFSAQWSFSAVSANAFLCWDFGHHRNTDSNKGIFLPSIT